jgi:hypothetical protein
MILACGRVTGFFGGPQNDKQGDVYLQERSDEAIHLEFQLDCRGRLSLPANEHTLFVIAKEP